jgi:hypothetical protein
MAARGDTNYLGDTKLAQATAGVATLFHLHQRAVRRLMSRRGGALIGIALLACAIGSALFIGRRPIR